MLVLRTMSTSTEVALLDFINKHVAIVSKQYKDTCSSYFIATNSGKKEAYKIAGDMQLALEKIYTNKEDFQHIKMFGKDNIHDPLLTRQLEILFLSYQSRQMDEEKLKEMVELQNKIENTFATCRAKIDNNEYTDNQIEDILSTSTDSEEVEKAWEASKEIGNIVAPDVIQIIHMRNTLAKDL